MLPKKHRDETLRHVPGSTGTESVEATTGPADASPQVHRHSTVLPLAPSLVPLGCAPKHTRQQLVPRTHLGSRGVLPLGAASGAGARTAGSSREEKAFSLSYRCVMVCVTMGVYTTNYAAVPGANVRTSAMCGAVECVSV